VYRLASVLLLFATILLSTLGASPDGNAVDSVQLDGSYYIIDHEHPIGTFDVNTLFTSVPVTVAGTG
jgi:hypothetical protein